MNVIKRIIFISMIFILSGTVPALAEEHATDPYTGEIITWDINGAGEEELAGLPENQGNGQSVEENIEDQFNVLQQMYINESAAETDGREVTSCRLLIPDYETFKWNQSNVNVILRGDTGIETFTLYRQSGFESREQLKVGRYALVSAKTIDGSMIFRTEDPWFDVTSTGENVLALYPGTGNISTADITISEELETVDVTEVDPESHKVSVVIIILIVIFIMLFIIGMAVIIILIARKKRDKYS